MLILFVKYLISDNYLMTRQG